MTIPTISVIVPVYNGLEFLESTVKSILEQTYTNFELLLINDGSKDTSLELIESLAKQDSRIRVFDKANGGVANARNFGISKANADLIAFCDQDDLWLPTKLEQQLPLFSQPEIGLVYCGSIARFTSNLPDSKADLSRFLSGDVFEDLLQQNVVSCCTAIARKQLILKVGGFREEVELKGVDDWMLWLHLAQCSKLAFVNEHLAVHIFHGDNYSLNELAMNSAEFYCIDQLSLQFSDIELKQPWPVIKGKLLLRHATDYKYIGEFRAAGEALSQAGELLGTHRYKIQGIAMKLIPAFMLRLLQRQKRLRTLAS
ncbi:glycosyltransferase [Alginatibacterium sediminis]|uniref:Glycosyltransferase n=1 Tax=Alginatibacterium sediminis TaxID=2164068 RepID=A0A420E7D2_9ALTE|nr:glycosyltransferase [Alginatibacterium sediminis]RKF14384.1 glycosyltransferase [Alginatibacterium sediminis]